MKINPSITTIGSGKDTQTPPSTRGQSPAGGASAPSDTIHLSTLSSQLHAIESNLASGSEFDSKKVSAIKQAITDGKFTVNTSVVADKLIATTQELLGKKP